MQVFGTPSRVIATATALCAFAIALLSGLASHNGTSTVLVRALISMALCYVLGHVLGACAESVVRRRVEAYKRDHPIPDVMGALRDVEEEVESRPSAAAA